ncbi:MAG: leucyl/phenylalanyl-tRNA--protein transferase [Phycisphaerae bacterium]|nr:leucyl/phenylalanyl-tRNA--protein transferase [Phycisphaerae bacterium]
MHAAARQNPLRMRADLEPELLLIAYANGIFPMADEDGDIYWYSPDPRAVIPLDTFRPARSLRKVCKRHVYSVVIDRDFSAVIHACANRPEGTWISSDIIEAYCRLHELGFAHSVEARDPGPQGALVGGLYGVAIQGAFFGESMFHRQTDASKVALVHLVERMKARNMRLLDVQFMTDHLRSLGAVEIPRRQYLERLEAALRQPCTFTDPLEDAPEDAE